MSRRTIWTEYRWLRAQRMRENGQSYLAIAVAFGLTEMQVEWKFDKENSRHRPSLTKRDLDPLLAERDRRSAASGRRTLTQEQFGDPAPGYSALDRKRAGVAP